MTSAPRQDYEMTEADLAKLLEACKPVALIATHCGRTLSPQEKANAAWAELGKRMLFDPMSVKPSPRGNRFFTAEPVECQGFEIEPGVFSGCNASAGDCPECGR